MHGQHQETGSQAASTPIMDSGCFFIRFKLLANPVNSIPLLSLTYHTIIQNHLANNLALSVKQLNSALLYSSVSIKSYGDTDVVYITNSNEQQIINRMAKIVYIDPEDLDLQYKSEITIPLSQKEIKRLVAIRELFKNFDFFIDKFFNKVPKIDTGAYVKKGCSPAYHTSQDCEALNADYTNYLIPPEVKGRGSNEIKKYRKWFLDNEDLLKTNQKRFEIQLSLNFKIRNMNTIEAITKPNTGSVSFDNLELGEIENIIDSLMLEAEKYRNSSAKIKAAIKWGGNNASYMSDDEDKNKILEKWHQYKRDLKDNLIAYYTVKHSPNLTFTGTLLEQLGFKECGSCKKQESMNFKEIQS